MLLAIICLLILHLKYPQLQVKGSETCLHKSQVCNLHAQCEPNPAKDADTAEDEFQCDGKYWEKRLISRQAAYRCQSPHHNKESKRNKTSLGVVWIRAVLNDGNVECWNGEDEEERSTDLVTFYLPGLELRFFACFSDQR